MKNTTKTWLIAAAVLIFTGLIIFVGAMMVNHWDWSKLANSNLGNGKMVTNTYQVDDAFRNIRIDSDTDEIRFVPAKDGSCKVECFEHETMLHTVSVQNGTLQIAVTDSRAWYEHVTLFSTGSPKITVFLPEREYDSLVIQEDTGDIDIPKDFSFNSVSITATTGDVEFRASVSGTAEIRLSTGSMQLENISAGALALKVSTGHVQVSDVACDGDVSVEVSTGRADLQNISCKNFITTGDTGRIELQQLTASGRISIKRTTGDVKFTDCDAAELDIRTDTGDVRGTLLSDKIFFTDTDTGRISVPRSTSGGTCDISTDTGDIDVKIAE